MYNLRPEIKHMGKTGTGRKKADVLTKYQRSILLCLEQGCTKHIAAEKIGTSVHTIDAHLRTIYRSMGVHTMPAAVAKAIREKII